MLETHYGAQESSSSLSSCTCCYCLHPAASSQQLFVTAQQILPHRSQPACNCTVANSVSDQVTCSRLTPYFLYLSCLSYAGPVWLPAAEQAAAQTRHKQPPAQALDQQQTAASSISWSGLTNFPAQSQAACCWRTHTCSGSVSATFTRQSFYCWIMGRRDHMVSSSTGLHSIR